MTTSAWLTIAIGPVLILVASWLMPALVPPTLPFGVRIPPDRVGAPLIAEQRRWYRWFISVAGGTLLVVGLLAMALFGDGPLLAIFAPLVVLGVCLAGYLRARAAIMAAKEHEHWYAGLRQGITTDTSLRTEPVTFPWIWCAPALAIIAGTVALAVIRYPHLPSRLITHINADGVVDRTVATSPLAVAAPIFVQVGVTAALLLATAFSVRARADIDPAAPRAAALRYRGFTVRVARAMLVLTAFVNLSLLGLYWQIWSNATTISMWPVIGPIIAGVIVIFGVVFTTGQLGGRIAADEPEPSTGLVHRDDDRYWKGGLFYVNRSDPALFLPKRFGVGWTVNFGNPKSLILVGVIIVVAIAPGILVSLAAPH